MALISSLIVLASVFLFCYIATAFGHLLLRAVNLPFSRNSEHLLCSLAVGVISWEVMLFFVECSGQIRLGVALTLGLLALVSVREFGPVFGRVSHAVSGIIGGSRVEKLLAGLLAITLFFEGLLAMAPLSGSDALHYHFTAPLLVLREGFHPNFYLSHSFFFGQSHLLILAGLALGSDRFAMGLLFLGGMAAAASTFCLARCWVTRPWALIVALVFLLTPVVFWQISAAGAPDLWMAFFATLGVVIISRAEVLHSSRLAVLAGILAGAIAGSKYTGCIVAAGMAVAFVREDRSLLRTSLFLLGAIGAGIWPYARNMAWAGDPMFPFLLPWIAPQRVNAYTLASYLADTGVTGSRSFWQVVKFPLFAAIEPAHAGFWQFFGPLVFGFVPLLILAVRNTSAWRVSLVVWISSALGIGATSGITRFLLPVLPIALAATFASVARLEVAKCRFARSISLAMVCFFALLGGVGLILYGRPALLAAVGRTSREDYLRLCVPDYNEIEFINGFLSGNAGEGKVLIFFRHPYYLHVPYVFGNPSASWAVDPAHLQTADEWRVLFRRESIHWVVRDPGYPPKIAEQLERLEVQGYLVPIARTEVTNFEGFRIFEKRSSQRLVILEVRD